MTDETTLAPLPWGRDVIESILPHRDPFVWVSRVVAIEPGQSITAELDVPADLDIFRGHFPDHPVLPGVIIMEALAQAASIAMLQAPDLRGRIVKSSRRLVVAEVEASVAGEVCATATQKYVLA